MNDPNKDKQAMQNTIKTIQAKADFINKLEGKASKVLVLQLGSHSIKLGFANERVPFVMKPFIAYKKKQESVMLEQKKVKNEEINSELFKKQYMNTETRLKNQCVISADIRPMKGKPRGKQIITFDRIPAFVPEKEVLYGEQALAVESDPEYIFCKPIQYGQLNIKSSDPEQVKSCINDLENILKYMLSSKLEIPVKERKSFSCIVVLSDVFIREHVKALILMLFRQLGFQKIYMHLESVLACLGTAISSAVVVDVGHEKISVCCVDEGVILPKTLIRKNYGLKDISKTIAKICNSKFSEEHSHSLAITREGDLYQVDQIKQIACAIREPEQTPNKVYQIHLVRQRQEYPMHISYSDSICVASNSFFSKILNSLPPEVEYREPFDSYSEMYALAEDNEDFFEEFSGGGQFYEIDKTNPNFSKSMADPFTFCPLEDIILASLMSIKDIENRKKFLGSILLVGGGGYLPQLGEETIRRVSKLFEKVELGGEKADQSTDLLLREIAPMHASWLGGTVLPKLDSLRDLWIEKGRYLGEMKEEFIDEEEEEPNLDKKLFTRKEESQQWGLRYLKEKLPFLW